MKKQILKRRLRLALSAIYLVAIFWWTSSTEGVSHALTLLAIMLCAGGTLGFIILSFRLKSAFNRLFAPGSLRVGSVEEFPHLDRAELERLTQCWQELGFELGVDHAGNMDNPANGQTFSRIFEHPTQGAIAEVSQSFLPSQIGPITLSVLSFWGERAPILQMAGQLKLAVNATAPLSSPGAPRAATPPMLPDEMEMWLLITHNRPPNKFWHLMRQQRLLSRRIKGDVAPETLWQTHLEQRALVESRLKLPHEIGGLEALLEAHSLVLSAQLQARLKRTAAWKFGLARFSRAASPTVYDGELTI